MLTADMIQETTLHVHTIYVKSLFYVKIHILPYRAQAI